MSQLSSYPNVFNTCLVLLQRGGYELRYDTNSDGWHAKKGEYSFLADNPMELLGLTAIYEKVAPSEPKEYWWKLDDPDLLSELDPE